MAITATVKYNDLRYTKNGQKRALKVEAAGQSEMVTIWLNPDQGEYYKKGDQISIEQKGAFWNMCKDQPAPGAPMSTTPATVTNGQGYTPHANDHEAIKQRAKLFTELYLQIAKQVHEDTTFAMEPGQVIAAATATIFIKTVDRP